MSCSSPQNSPLLSLWALRMGASVERTREAFHTALASQPTGLPDPDPGDVTAYLRRHMAGAIAGLDPATAPHRITQALQGTGNVIHRIETGEIVVDGATFAAWQQVGDAYGPTPTIAARPQAVGGLSQSGRRPRREYAGGGRRPYHKRFTRFNTRTLEATDALFTARPSRLSDEEKLVVFNRWLDEVSDAYGMERPALNYTPATIAYGVDHYRGDDHEINLATLSVTTLLHEFRHAMQSKEAGPPMLGEPQDDPGLESERIEVDARAWSLSLYYQCRPRLLERLVREGRILHLPPEDLD